MFLSLSFAVPACIQSDTRLAPVQCVTLRRLGQCGHFQSRDEDGCHIIRSAIPEKLILHANIKTLSFTDAKLLPMKLSYSRNANFGKGRYKYC